MLLVMVASFHLQKTQVASSWLQSNHNYTHVQNMAADIHYYTLYLLWTCDCYSNLMRNDKNKSRTSPVRKYEFVCQIRMTKFFKENNKNLRSIGDCLVPAQASSPGKCFQCSGSWLGSRIRNIYEIRIFHIFFISGSRLGQRIKNS